MAGKKRKGKKRLKQKMKYELLGLLFIFLAVFGSGASAISDGVIPGGLENVFRFFLGIWYFVASLALLITGIYLLVKRKYPDYSNKKLIGFYLGFVGLILLTHIQTYEQLIVTNGDTSIVKLTWNNFFDYLNGHESALQLGGGLVGGLLFTFTYFLFSSVGAKIVAAFSIIIGFIFMTEFSLGDFFSKIGQKFVSFYKSQKEKIREKRDAKKQQETVDANEVEVEITTNDPLPSEQLHEPVIQDFTDVAYPDTQTIQSETDSNSDQDTKNESDDDELLKYTVGAAEIENDDYELPSIELLAEPAYSSQQHEKSQIQSTVKTLERTF